MVQDWWVKRRSPHMWSYNESFINELYCWGVLHLKCTLNQIEPELPGAFIYQCIIQSCLNKRVVYSAVALAFRKNKTESLLDSNFKFKAILLEMQPPKDREVGCCCIEAEHKAVICSALEGPRQRYLIFSTTFRHLREEKVQSNSPTMPLAWQEKAYCEHSMSGREHCWQKVIESKYS